MNLILMPLVISGAVSLAVSVLAYIFGKRRDSEGEWRRLKLEGYKEFWISLSGIVHNGKSQEAHRRYADAVNSLILIAPVAVLIALDAFQNQINFKNSARTDSEYDSLLSKLARAMRIDSQPHNPKDPQDYVFRTLDIPTLDRQQ